MRNSLLTAAIAFVLPMSALAQHTPVPDVEIMPLPDGVTSVQPAQGYVDLSSNYNPLGVREITVNFRSTPAINPDCKAMATCDYNGTQTASVTNASSYIDAMGQPTASVNFGKTLTAPGVYNVVIPEGFWLYNGLPSPEIKLNYEIFDLYRISPAPGLVESISEIVMDFPLADEVELANRSSVEFFRANPEEIFSIRYNTVANPTDGRLNRVVMTLMESSTASVLSDLTAPGSYCFHAVAGAFKAIVYGPDHATNSNDYTVWETPEIVNYYEIAACPAPTIDPAQGTLHKFESFTLTVPSVFELVMVDDRNNKSGIYALNADGTVAADPICRLKAERNWDVPGEFTLTVADSRGVVVPGGITPENGDYMMILGTSLFSGFFNGQFINSAPYQYRFTINNLDVKVEGLGAGDEDVTVYNLAGIRVLDKADASALRTLPAGLYIVNGKKVALR